MEVNLSSGIDCVHIGSRVEVLLRDDSSLLRLGIYSSVTDGTIGSYESRKGLLKSIQKDSLIYKL